MSRKIYESRSILKCSISDDRVVVAAEDTRPLQHWLHDVHKVLAEVGGEGPVKGHFRALAVLWNV